jgi:hypothetical protein
MQTSKTGLDPPSENDAVLAETLGKIYTIVLNEGERSAAQKILNRAKLDQLMLHLLAAPEAMLLAC